MLFARRCSRLALLVILDLSRPFVDLLFALLFTLSFAFALAFALAFPFTFTFLLPLVLLVPLAKPVVLVRLPVFLLAERAAGTLALRVTG
jgi:hypothetical protein